MPRPKNPISPATPEILREIGEAAYGDAWYSPMARVLSRYHPTPGTEMHGAIVRNWATGARSIPPWVSPALTLVAIAEHERLEVLRRELLARMERVEGGVGRLLDRGASWLEFAPAREAEFDARVRAWMERREEDDD